MFQSAVIFKEICLLVVLIKYKDSLERRGINWQAEYYLYEEIWFAEEAVDDSYVLWKAVQDLRVSVNM